MKIFGAIYATLALVLMPVANMPASAQDAPVIRLIMNTDKGDIELELYPAQAPKTVANFMTYVDTGLFDGGEFYRVVRPDNDQGSPVISVIQGQAAIVGEAPFPPVAHESTAETGILHEDGVISMARDGPGTATHAFFITIGAQPGLDHGALRNPDGLGFAAFGKVTAGMDVVRGINRLKGEAEADDPYVKGQVLARPVLIMSVRRK